MAHKEYDLTDIIDILRRTQAGDSIRRTAKATGMDRKTISNYLRLANEHGFSAGMAEDQLAEIALAVFRDVHGPGNKSSTSERAASPIIPHCELLADWLEKDGIPGTPYLIQYPAKPILRGKHRGSVSTRYN